MSEKKTVSICLCAVMCSVEARPATNVEWRRIRRYEEGNKKTSFGL